MLGVHDAVKMGVGGTVSKEVVIGGMGNINLNKFLILSKKVKETCSCWV